MATKLAHKRVSLHTSSPSPSFLAVGSGSGDHLVPLIVRSPTPTLVVVNCDIRLIPCSSFPFLCPLSLPFARYCVQLTKEFQAMQKAPPPFIYARFDEKNILDCESSSSSSSSVQVGSAVARRLPFGRSFMALNNGQSREGPKGNQANLRCACVETIADPSPCFSQFFPFFLRPPWPPFFPPFVPA